MAEERRRLGQRHPAHLVDLVAGPGLALGAHAEVAHFLEPAAAVAVPRPAHLLAHAAHEPGLLLHLPPRRLLPGLARLELALGQRPVVVARAVDDQQAAVADDHPSPGLDLGHAHTSTRSASPWPPPEQIAASPRPPPLRRSSCTSVARMRPPEAPMGWPSATAPPLTLTRSSSAPSREVEWAATEEKASLISTRATSSIVLPAAASATPAALAGVRAK